MYYKYDMIFSFFTGEVVFAQLQQYVTQPNHKLS